MSEEIDDALGDVHTAIEDLEAAFRRLGRAKIVEVPGAVGGGAVRVEDVMDVGVTVTIDHELKDPPSEA